MKKKYLDLTGLRQVLSKIKSIIGEVKSDYKLADSALERSVNVLDQQVANMVGATTDIVKNIKNLQSADVTLKNELTSAYKAADGKLYDSINTLNNTVTKLNKLPTSPFNYKGTSKGVKHGTNKYISSSDSEATAKPGDVVLVINSDPTDSSKYKEYLYVDDSVHWERLGQEDITPINNSEINSLFN